MPQARPMGYAWSDKIWTKRVQLDVQFMHRKVGCNTQAAVCRLCEFSVLAIHPTSGHLVSISYNWLTDPVG